MIEDLACPHCEHLNAEHRLLASADLRDGGARICNASDVCTCIVTWTPRWDGHDGLLPDFAIVVLQVRQWADTNAWSEDRLIDTLARFERTRR